MSEELKKINLKGTEIYIKTSGYPKKYTVGLGSYSLSFKYIDIIEYEYFYLLRFITARDEYFDSDDLHFRSVSSYTNMQTGNYSVVNLKVSDLSGYSNLYVTIGNDGIIYMYSQVSSAVSANTNLIFFIPKNI